MDKKNLLMLCVIGLAAVMLVTNIMPNSMYQISDDTSTYEATPLEGVTLSIEADYEEAFLTVKNDTDEQLYLEFAKNPPVVEVMYQQAWHPLLPTVECSLAPSGLARGSATTVMRWKEHLLGGLLSTGDYRIIVTYETDSITYRDDVEFHVK